MRKEVEVGMAEVHLSIISRENTVSWCTVEYLIIWLIQYSNFHQVKCDENPTQSEYHVVVSWFISKIFYIYSPDLLFTLYQINHGVIDTICLEVNRKKMEKRTTALKMVS